ncbi:MAG TPA: molybdopterin cofactor-binding domain-containing protein [Burkholderiaceae bacterium]|nr:molybdopterin cofactor-binding domain-containing protein [Burkholderiaceae bacterium]
MSTVLSRRRFLAAGGSLTVGFNLSVTLNGLAAAATPATPAGGRLGVDSWIEISGGDDTLVTIYAGKVELGTGVRTALTQIVAEELAVTFQQVAYVQGDTDRTPGSQGYTAGSKTIQNEGPSLRLAAATALQGLLGLACAQFGVDVSQLRVKDGRIGLADQRRGSKTYGQLIGSQNYQMASSATAPVKPVGDYSIVGKSVKRVDLPGRFTAKTGFLAEFKLPGMLHARVVRPAGRNAAFVSFDGASLSAVQSIPGVVQVVRQGNFVAVVASEEYAAIVGARTLRVNWSAGAAMIPQELLPTALQDPANIYASGNEVNSGNVDAALAASAATLSATYFTPFQMHASLGASCAVADVNMGQQRASVWSSTQGPFPLRGALSVLLGLPETSVRVIYVEGSGCYGHNGADDAAAEAALISKLVGKPIRLQWTRAEEHGWEPLTPAMVHKMRGGITGATCMAWEHSVYSPSHNSRPSLAGAGNLLPMQLLGSAPADAPAPGANAATRNAPVTYSFANNRLIRNFVRSFNLVPGTRKAALPLTWSLPRTSALRSLGGYSNTFANESFMDELAKKANADPLAFRLQHTGDARAAAVMQAAADKAGWGSAMPAAPRGFAAGRGIGFVRYETVETYVAAVAEVLVNKKTGEVRVTRVVVAHDCGLIVNPDGLRSQIEGNVIQGVSRTLKEEVTYSGDSITSTAWDDRPGERGYPVLQFDEVPDIDIELIDRPTEPAWGAGEAAIGCLGGAIGNAICHATGARVRTLPMTPAVVKAALPA